MEEELNIPKAWILFITSSMYFLLKSVEFISSGSVSTGVKVTVGAIVGIGAVGTGMVSGGGELTQPDIIKDETATANMMK